VDDSRAAFHLRLGWEPLAAFAHRLKKMLDLRGLAAPWSTPFTNERLATSRGEWDTEPAKLVRRKSATIANPAGCDGVIQFMNSNLLDIKFARIGARLKVADRPTRRNRTTGAISLDVQADRTATTNATGLSPASQRRRLSEPFVRRKRHSSPPRSRMRKRTKDLRAKARSRRKNAAYIRQGEWFFLQVADLAVDQRFVLLDEPLTRGNGGKPHWAEFLFRTGGEAVYVCSHYPNGVTEARYRGILTGNATAKSWGWRIMRRNPGVFVKGRIRHADHATITLRGWQRVLMNTEGESKAMKNVAFLD
jgi:hypothetical protein